MKWISVKNKLPEAEVDTIEGSSRSVYILDSTGIYRARLNYYLTDYTDEVLWLLHRPFFIDKKLGLNVTYGVIKMHLKNHEKNTVTHWCEYKEFIELVKGEI